MLLAAREALHRERREGELAGFAVEMDDDLALLVHVEVEDVGAVVVGGGDEVLELVVRVGLLEREALLNL